MRVVFLLCYQKPWKQISPMTNHIRWMFAKKQTRVKFTVLLSSFIVYSFIVPCCFLRNIIIAWIKINANMNVNRMLINCVIVTLFLFLEIVYEKINYESILWSSQKGHEYCFSIKKMIKIKKSRKKYKFQKVMLAQKNYVTLEPGCACVLRIHCTCIAKWSYCLFHWKEK